MTEEQTADMVADLMMEIGTRLGKLLTDVQSMVRTYPELKKVMNLVAYYSVGPELLTKVVMGQKQFLKPIAEQLQEEVNNDE